jgi:hypothetical protein
MEIYPAHARGCVEAVPVSYVIVLAFSTYQVFIAMLSLSLPRR